MNKENKTGKLKGLLKRLVPSLSQFKNIIFISFLIILILPIAQSKTNRIKLNPLRGVIVTPENLDFRLKDWFTADYQKKKEEYLNSAFGFRSIFIRINNQIAFNFFRQAKANGVIIGKENYLFEESYINAYYGNDFIGKDSITHRMKRLKFVSDTLSKLNKSVILVFAAGKGSFYPEYFPDKYKQEKGITNYEYHVKLAEEYGLNYIDFLKYFNEYKETSEYPLFPKYGIHWSLYGHCLAADSIIHYIEDNRNIDCPELYWTKIDMHSARNEDYDIGDGMNLLFRLKGPKMAYPNIQFESDSGKVKPTVMVLSDSYYWAMFNFGISNAFKDSHFWFYGKQIYPDTYTKSLTSDQVILKDEIAKHDVIIIMATEATLPGLGWDFIENCYNLYH